MSRLSRRVAATLGFVAALTIAAPVRAAEPGGDELADRRWYGGLTLLAASPGALTVAVASACSSSEVFALGVTGMALGPPIVHMAYGNWGKGVGALAMNVALGTAGLFIGYGAMYGTRGDRDRALDVGAPIGLTAGVLTAVAIDAAFVAWDDPAPARVARRRAPPRAGVLPAVQVAPGQASLGLVGAF